MYEQLGLTPAEWCSTTNPQGKCSPVSGICKPMTTAALNAIYALQRELNRFAVVYGFTKTTVDGRIGALTLGLYNKVAAKHPPLMTYATCDGLSAVAEGVTTSLAGIADSLKAPAASAVPAPITSRPSKPNPSGGAPINPPALAITDTVFNMVSSPFGFLIAAALGYGAYRLAKGGKKKGGGTRRRRSTRYVILKPARSRRRRVRRTRRRRR